MVVTVNPDAKFESCVLDGFEAVAPCKFFFEGFDESWSVPLKNWTGMMNFSYHAKHTKFIILISGRGQADDSLPGTGAGSPRLCLCWKGDLL
jgi:hypothetical protein